MKDKDCNTAEDKKLEEKRKQEKRERAAEKRRRNTRDKHRMQGLEHTRKASEETLI